MDLNYLTYHIRGAIFSVYNELGPGLLESVYEAALFYELNKLGFITARQVPLPVIYKDVKLDLGFRLDLLIENKILVEIKSVEALNDVHKKQVLTYLKLSKVKIGLLVNFNTDKLIDRSSIFRIINSL